VEQQTYEEEEEASIESDTTEYKEENNEYYVEKVQDEKDFYENKATGYIEENNEYYEEKVQDEKDYYENKVTEYKEREPISEEIFDATQQQQSFAAAVPGSAVLSHESDPSTHVSADMFSRKPLYGSGERVWCGSALIFVTLCNIVRLLR